MKLDFSKRSKTSDKDLFLTVEGSPRFESRRESDVQEVHRAAKTSKTPNEENISPRLRRSECIVGPLIPHSRHKQVSSVSVEYL